MLDDGAETRRFGAQHRRVGRHRDELAHVADGEREVDARLLARGQPDAVASHRPKTGQLDVDAVLAGRKTRGREHALGARGRYALQVRPDVGDGHRGAGCGRSGLILHDARDFSARHLGARWQGARSHAPGRDHEQGDRPTSTALSAQDHEAQYFNPDLISIQIDCNRLETLQSLLGQTGPVRFSAVHR